MNRLANLNQPNRNRLSGLLEEPRYSDMPEGASEPLPPPRPSWIDNLRTSLSMTPQGQLAGEVVQGATMGALPLADPRVAEEHPNLSYAIQGASQILPIGAAMAASGGAAGLPLLPLAVRGGLSFGAAAAGSKALGSALGTIREPASKTAGDIGKSIGVGTVFTGASGAVAPVIGKLPSVLRPPANIASSGGIMTGVGSAERAIEGVPTTKRDVISELAFGGAFGLLHVIQSKPRLSAEYRARIERGEPPEAVAAEMAMLPEVQAELQRFADVNRPDALPQLPQLPGMVPDVPLRPLGETAISETPRPPRASIAPLLGREGYTLPESVRPDIVAMARREQPTTPTIKQNLTAAPAIKQGVTVQPKTPTPKIEQGKAEVWTIPQLRPEIFGFGKSPLSEELISTRRQSAALRAEAKKNNRAAEEYNPQKDYANRIVDGLREKATTEFKETLRKEGLLEAFENGAAPKEKLLPFIEAHNAKWNPLVRAAYKNRYPSSAKPPTVKESLIVQPSPTVKESVTVQPPVTSAQVKGKTPVRESSVFEKSEQPKTPAPKSEKPVPELSTNVLKSGTADGWTIARPASSEKAARADAATRNSVGGKTEYTALQQGDKWFLAKRERSQSSVKTAVSTDVEKAEIAEIRNVTPKTTATSANAATGKSAVSPEKREEYALRNYPQYKASKEIKARYPDGIVMMRQKDIDRYTVYGEDATRAAEVLGLETRKLYGTDVLYAHIDGVAKEHSIEKLVKARIRVITGESTRGTAKNVKTSSTPVQKTPVSTKSEQPKKVEQRKPTLTAEETAQINKLPANQRASAAQKMLKEKGKPSNLQTVVTELNSLSDANKLLPFRNLAKETLKLWDDPQRFALLNDGAKSLVRSIRSEQKPAPKLDQAEAAAKERIKKRGGGSLYSNPIPEIIKTARDVAEIPDRLIRPQTEKVARAMGRAVDALPEPIKRGLKGRFSAIPEVKEDFQNLLREKQQGRDTAAFWGRQFLGYEIKPGTPQAKALDRILRNEADPQAVLRDVEQGKQGAAAKDIQDAQGLLMEYSSQLQALGLPVNEKLMNAGKNWYGSYYKQHLGSVVIGKLFGATSGRPGTLPMKIGAHLKTQYLTRHWILDTKTGKPAYDYKAKQQMIFESAKARDTALAANPEAKTWKPVDPMTIEQRAAHGLIEDVFYNLPRSIAETSQEVAIGKFWQGIAKSPAVIGPEPNAIKFSDLKLTAPTRRMLEGMAANNPRIKSMLDGYLERNTAKDLEATLGEGGFLPRWFTKAERFGRQMVTTYNPARHLKQPIENELQLWLADAGATVNLAQKARSGRDYVKSVRGEATPRYKEFVEDGFVTADMTGIDAQAARVLSDIYDVKIKEPYSDLNIGQKFRVWADAPGRLQGVKNAAELAQNMYRHEDQIYKFHLYRYLRDIKGVERKRAAQLTRDSLFDYENMPRIIRSVNRAIPFAPNVMWQFSRIFANHLREQPASFLFKVALMGTIPYLIDKKGREEAGLTEQAVRAMGDRAPRFPAEIVLPATDSRGKPLVLNMTWLLPYGEFYRYPTSLKDFPRATTQALPVIARGPITTAFNRTVFGQDLYRDTDSPGERRTKAAENMFVNGYAPPLVSSYWRNIYRSTEGESRARSMGENLVTPLTGRIQRLDIKGTSRMQAAIKVGSVRDLQTEMRRQSYRYARKEISRKAYNEQMTALKEKLRTSVDELRTQPKTPAYQRP